MTDHLDRDLMFILKYAPIVVSNKEGLVARLRTLDYTQANVGTSVWYHTPALTPYAELLQLTQKLQSVIHKAFGDIYTPLNMSQDLANFYLKYLCGKNTGPALWMFERFVAKCMTLDGYLSPSEVMGRLHTNWDMPNVTLKIAEEFIFAIAMHKIHEGKNLQSAAATIVSPNNQNIASLHIYDEVAVGNKYYQPNRIVEFGRFAIGEDTAKLLVSITYEWLARQETLIFEKKVVDAYEALCQYKVCLEERKKLLQIAARHISSVSVSISVFSMMKECELNGLCWSQEFYEAVVDAKIDYDRFFIRAKGGDMAVDKTSLKSKIMEFLTNSSVVVHDKGILLQRLENGGYITANVGAILKYHAESRTDERKVASLIAALHSIICEAYAKQPEPVPMGWRLRDIFNELAAGNSHASCVLFQHYAAKHDAETLYISLEKVEKYFRDNFYQCSSSWSDLARDFRKAVITQKIANGMGVGEVLRSVVAKPVGVDDFVNLVGRYKDLKARDFLYSPSINAKGEEFEAFTYFLGVWLDRERTKQFEDVVIKQYEDVRQGITSPAEKNRVISQLYQSVNFFADTVDDALREIVNQNGLRCSNADRFVTKVKEAEAKLRGGEPHTVKAKTMFGTVRRLRRDPEPKSLRVLPKDRKADKIYVEELVSREDAREIFLTAAAPFLQTKVAEHKDAFQPLAGEDVDSILIFMWANLPDENTIPANLFVKDVLRLTIHRKDDCQTPKFNDALLKVSVELIDFLYGKGLNCG